jgi:hypothetical protein
MSDVTIRMCSNYISGLGYCVFTENHEGACVFPAPRPRTYTESELAERVKLERAAALTMAADRLYALAEAPINTPDQNDLLRYVAKDHLLDLISASDRATLEQHDIAVIDSITRKFISQLKGESSAGVPEFTEALAQHDAEIVAEFEALAEDYEKRHDDHLKESGVAKVVHAYDVAKILRALCQKHGGGK